MRREMSWDYLSMTQVREKEVERRSQYHVHYSVTCCLYLNYSIYVINIHVLFIHLLRNAVSLISCYSLSVSFLCWSNESCNVCPSCSSLLLIVILSLWYSCACLLSSRSSNVARNENNGNIQCHLKWKWCQCQYQMSLNDNVSCETQCNLNVVIWRSNEISILKNEEKYVMNVTVRSING
jgi:hypothetical protein